MRRIFFTTIMSVVFISNIMSQKSIDSSILILGWDIFDLKANFITQRKLSNDIETMIGLRTEATFKKLYSALDDTNKAVAIHIILSRTYGQNIFDIKTEYKDGQNGDILSTKYNFRGLIW